MSDWIEKRGLRSKLKFESNGKEEICVGAQEVEDLR